MPLGGLDRIFRRAAAFGENAREPVLGNAVAVQRRLTEDHRRGLFVLGHTVAVKQAMPNSTCASALSASAASPHSRVASFMSFATPRPCL